MDTKFDDKDIMTMKLLHYFITVKDYNPVVLHGVTDEIWLENMDSDYKIVRIVSGYIHNNEQLSFDLFKTKRIVKSIKKKTFNVSMDVLSIFIDLGDNVDLVQDKHISCVNLKDESDIKKYDFIYESFPDIDKKLTFTEKGMNLFLKITNDINKRNVDRSVKIEKVFAPQKPIVTSILIVINVLIFLFGFLFGTSDFLINSFSVFGPYIRAGEYYRLITGAFIHVDLLHILFNMYALYILGSQAESFFGRFKFLLIYFVSAITGSLLSILLNGSTPSIGASGAIFGILGALLYFGYNYRVYLGSTLVKELVPILIINLSLGFLIPGIDNFAHIGGVVGGYLVSMALGFKENKKTIDRINGIVIFFIYLAFLLFMNFIYI